MRYAVINSACVGVVCDFCGLEVRRRCKQRGTAVLVPTSRISTRRAVLLENGTEPESFFCGRRGDDECAYPLGLGDPSQ